MRLYTGPNINLKQTRVLDITELENNNNALNISEFADLCVEDHVKWKEIFSQYPAIYHRGLGIAYVPLGSPVDCYFLKGVKTHQSTYWVIKELPEEIPKFTIVTDPLIRLCIGFRYTDNNIWYNISGHPRGCFMSGIRVIESAFNNNQWQLKNQIDVIKEKNIDIAIPYNINCSEDGRTIGVDLELKHGIGHYLHEMYKWTKNWHEEQLSRLWEWGSPYNVFLTRHPFLEESIHYNVINNEKISRQICDYYSADYHEFDYFLENDGVPTSFKHRYDHYWIKQNV